MTAQPRPRPAPFNVTVVAPASVILDGSVTDDGLPLPTMLDVLWTQVSGPTAVSFANPTSAVTQAGFTQVGTYVLRLIADDSEYVVFDEIVITVFPIGATNLAPIVDAGPDQNVNLSDVVALDGLVIDDGQPTTNLLVSWSQISGPGVASFSATNTAATTFTFTNAGT